MDRLYGWRIIKEMLRHVWPRDQPKLKIRVVIALSLLVGAKVCNGRLTPSQAGASYWWEPRCVKGDGHPLLGLGPVIGGSQGVKGDGHPLLGLGLVVGANVCKGG